MTAGDIAASGNGTFDPIASVVDLRLAVRITPEKTKALLARTEELSPLVDDQGRLTLSLDVDGALTAPSFRVDLSQVLGSLRKEKKDAVRDLLEGLLDRDKD
jgi:hypothetical protein